MEERESGEEYENLHDFFEKFETLKNNFSLISEENNECDKIIKILKLTLYYI